MLSMTRGGKASGAMMGTTETWATVTLMTGTMVPMMGHMRGFWGRAGSSHNGVDYKKNEGGGPQEGKAWPAACHRSRGGTLQLLLITMPGGIHGFMN